MDLESKAFRKEAPNLSLVMDRAQRLWSSSPLFVPLNHKNEALSHIIGSYLYTCGFADLRTAAGEGPRRNFEPGIFISVKLIQITDVLGTGSLQIH